MGIKNEIGHKGGQICEKLNSPSESKTWPLFLFKNNLLRIMYNLVGASQKFIYSLPSYALTANKR